MFSKKAFSLVEAIILVTILAVAIVATMPVISRKVVNANFEGASVGGANHGRYEVYRDGSNNLYANLYSGTHVVYKNKKLNSKTVEFAPPENAQNIMIYAVGAGGAGGGLNNQLGGVERPGDSAEVNARILKDLEKRFYESKAGMKYINGNGPSFSNYVTVNSNGTITVKANVDTGLALYQDLVKFTSQLGNHNRASITHPMPKWFDWKDLGRFFEAYAVACGGAGGAGSSLFWATGSWDDIPCMRNAMGCHSGPSKSCYNKVTCPSYNTKWLEKTGEKNSCPADVTGTCDTSNCNCKTKDSNDKCTECEQVDITVEKELNCDSKSYCASAKCQYKCLSSYYSFSGSNYVDVVNKPYTCPASPAAGSSCKVPPPEWPACPSWNTAGAKWNAGANGVMGPAFYRNETICNRTYPGGEGGAAPPCVKLSKTITGAMNVKVICAGSGADAADVSSSSQFNAIEDTGSGYGYGEQGATCTAIVDGYSARSVGGTGGCPYTQHFNATTIKGKMPADCQPKVNQAMRDCHSTGDCAPAQCPDADGDGNPETHEVKEAYDEIMKEIKTLHGSLHGSYVEDDSALTFLSELSYENFLNGMSHIAELFSITKRATDSVQEEKFIMGKDLLCEAMVTAPAACSGTAGYAECPDNLPEGYKCEEVSGGSTPSGRYNYLYEWTVPYGTNQLGYGESGTAGEYQSTKISKVPVGAKIKIDVGKGGMWTDSNKWYEKSTGPKGTDTVVKIGAKTIIKAKGGEGGPGGYLTDRYNLCYIEDKNGTCEGAGTCCTEAQMNNKVVDNVAAKKSKESDFGKNIKSAVPVSELKDKGFGNSGNGASSVSGEGFLYGTRKLVNKSAASSKGPSNSTVDAFTQSNNSTLPKDAYENTYDDKGAIGINGKPGAVIITW